MSPDAQPLPIAPFGCTLDDQQLADQLARYRQLSNNVLRVTRKDTTAEIQLEEPIDSELLAHTLATEHDCCSFFTLNYNATARVLSIATDRKHTDALTTLLAALTPTTTVEDMSPTPIPTAEQR